ncbi:MAG: hypothetical protein WD993_04835 [Thermoleophilaceae bacterium]
MTPLTIVAVAFVLSLLLFGFAFWTPIYAVPLALLFLIGLGISEMARRRGASREVRDLRSKAERGAPEHETDFTDRDRQTLYDNR